MELEAEAGIFYGYRTKIPDDENIKQAKRKAEKINLKLIEIKENKEDRYILLGKEIEKTKIPSLEEVTAKQFLKEITNIAKTNTLIQLEKDLQLLSEEPKLIIAGRIIND